MKKLTDKKKTEKKKKSEYVDDGHTVYDMSGLDGGRDKRDNVGLTKSERRAFIKAALGRYMPIVLMTILCFALVATLLSFWLLH